MATILKTGPDPVQEGRVDVGGVNARYQVAGAGPPVVLVHGLGSSIVSWRSNIRPLSESFRIIAVELPGHGLSAPYRGQYSLAYASRFIQGFLDSLKIDRVSLVGSSLGGLVALKTALDFPDRVDRLVLVSSAGLGRDLAFFLRILTIPVLGEFLARPTRKATFLSLQKVIYDYSLITQELIDEVHRHRALPEASRTMLRVLRVGANLLGQKPKVVQLDKLPLLKPPTLVLWGAQDQVLPKKHAYYAHQRIKESRLHVFQGCGHWPQMEKSGEFNSLVTAFLQGTP